MPESERQLLQQLLRIGRRTRECVQLKCRWKACIKHGTDRRSNSRKRHVTLHPRRYH